MSNVQSIFYDWMRRLASVIENEGEYIIEYKRNGFLLLSGCGDRTGGRGLSFHPVYYHTSGNFMFIKDCDDSLTVYLWVTIGPDRISA
jgi:hypothetical protein